MNKKIFILSSLFIFSLQFHVNAAQKDPLLEEVIAGHNALRQSIRTFSAQVVAENEIPTKELLMKGKYWRLQDTARIQDRINDKGCQDFLVSPTDLRIVTRSNWVDGEPTRIYATRKPGNASRSWCDVWGEFGLEMRLPNGDAASYETMIARANKVDPCRKVNRNNRPCIQVTIQEINNAKEVLTTTLFHDIGYNYFIVEMLTTTSFDDGSGKFTTKLSNFMEAAPGIYFPLTSILDTEKKGKVNYRRITTLSELAINAPMKPEEMALPEIPDGTPLEDRVAGITGTIDSKWNWIEQTGKTKPPEILPSLPRTSYEGPSLDEPTSFWNWAILFGGGFFVVTGAMLIYLKSRQ